MKGKFYRSVVRPAMLYGAECWAVKKTHVRRLHAAEMRMLRWMCGKTRLDRISNEVIRRQVGMVPVEDKLREARLRWFGHVRRRDADALVRRCERITVFGGSRGRGRPKNNWEEVIRQDLGLLTLTEDMALDRNLWRTRIRVAGVSRLSPFKNRELMYKKYEREGVVSQEWVDNVVEFGEYCESSPNVDRLDNKKMRCPCKKCKNIKFCSSKNMLEHILRFGFTSNYFDWVCHDENHGDYVPPQRSKVPRQADASDVSHVPSREQFVHMIYDAVGPTRINFVVEEEPNLTDKC
ncbi:unnamed protein product [Cuscuta campestris]|uniref:Transposase-associated domain-containing protein n=1 Tax=Cuscuta campestris TaxID=132261 RepID=A0A484MS03_9ASTE|nr:unnamed protein product [Cuscuta campestris]